MNFTFVRQNLEKKSTINQLAINKHTQAITNLIFVFCSLINCTAYPIWNDLFQSSKLKARGFLLQRTGEIKPTSFELSQISFQVGCILFIYSFCLINQFEFSSMIPSSSACAASSQNMWLSDLKMIYIYHAWWLVAEGKVHEETYSEIWIYA